MQNESQAQGTEENNNHRGESAQAFAHRRVLETEQHFKEVKSELTELRSRIEDVANIAGEIGSKVLPDTSSKNPVARAVHFLDEKLSQAAPYLRVGAATVAVVGGTYGAVKAGQAGYRWLTADKAMDINED